MAVSLLEHTGPTSELSAGYAALIESRRWELLLSFVQMKGLRLILPTTYKSRKSHFLFLVFLFKYFLCPLFFFLTEKDFKYLEDT